jgi:hypothetical protein
MVDYSLYQSGWTERVCYVRWEFSKLGAVGEAATFYELLRRRLPEGTKMFGWKSKWWDEPWDIYHTVMVLPALPRVCRWRSQPTYTAHMFVVYTAGGEVDAQPDEVCFRANSESRWAFVQRYMQEGFRPEGVEGVPLCKDDVC